MPPHDGPTPSARRVFTLTAAILGLLSICWALATPIFASPDENAHAIKAIAQVRGQIFGEVVEGSKSPVYYLPPEYSYHPQIVCFAFQPTANGGCGVELGDLGDDFFGSWVSSYNPVYYYLVGWPTLFLEGSAGVYGMRIVSALLCSVLLAGAATASLVSARARWMALAVPFLASPMVLFLGASVNPQGMDIAAGALLTIALLRLGETHADPGAPGLGRRTLWVLVTVAAVLLAIARATGPLWVLIIVGGVLLLLGWRVTRSIFTTRGSYIGISIIAAGGLFAVIWTFATGFLGTQAVVGDAPLVGGSVLEGAWAMFRDTYRWLQESAGIFGWLDTALPTMVYVVYFSALAILLGLALVAPNRRDRIAVAVTLAVAVLVPVVVQASSVSRTGIIWQGRYAMFLYISVILVAAWLLSRSAPDRDGLAPKLGVLVGILVSGYGVAAFAIVLHRYVVGAEATVGEMFADPPWQPPLGWIPLLLLYVLGSAALAGWIVRVTRRTATLAPAGT